MTPNQASSPDDFDPAVSTRGTEHVTDADIAHSLGDLTTATRHLKRDIPSFQAKGEANSFLLYQKIGEGGQGEVWLAEQSELMRMVAIKIFMDDSEESFLQEALVAAALDHPNIVPVHMLNRFEHEGRLRTALVMKLVSGVPWSKQIHSEHPGAGREPPQDYVVKHLRIFLSVCNAVGYAHSRGIIHRDIKPSQVVLGEFGEVYLTDWGLALSLGELDDDTSRPIRQSLSLPTPETAPKCCGTFAYMAPEQAWPDNLRISTATDIFLMGGLLFEVMTAEHPRDRRPNRLAAIAAVETNALRPIPEWMPVEIATLLKSCLATLPANRPRSIRELQECIQDYVDGMGRQKRSREVTGIVARDLESMERGSESYELLGKLNDNLTTASELWSANPDLEALREEVSARRVRHALANGDLGFARGALEALPTNSMQRQELAAEIATAERKQERSNQQKRLALMASLLLLVAIGAISIIFGQKQREARLVIEKGKAEAENAKASTQQTLETVLYKLDVPLRRTDNIETMEEIGKLAKGYYSKFSLEELSKNELLNYALSHEQMSFVNLSKGNIGAAKVDLTEAYKINVFAYKQRQSDEALARMAGNFQSLAYVEESVGNLRKAAKSMQQSADYYKELANDTSPVTFSLVLSQAEAYLALYLASIGEMAKIEGLIDSAMARLVKMEKRGGEWKEPDTQTQESILTIIGIIKVQYLNDPKGMEMVSRARISADSRKGSHRADSYFLKQYASVLFSEGQCLCRTGNPEAGLKSISEAETVWATVAVNRFDRMGRVRRAWMLVTKARVLLSLKKTAEAAYCSVQALELIETSGLSTSNFPNLQYVIAWSNFILGECHAEWGVSDRAEEYYLTSSIYASILNTSAPDTLEFLTLQRLLPETYVSSADACEAVEFQARSGYSDPELQKGEQQPRK